MMADREWIQRPEAAARRAGLTPLDRLIEDRLAHLVFSQPSLGDTSSLADFLLDDDGLLISGLLE